MFFARPVYVCIRRTPQDVIKMNGAAVGIGKGYAAAVPWYRRGDWYMDVLPPSLQALPTPSIFCRSL